MHDLTKQDGELTLEQLAITLFSHVVNLGNMNLVIFDIDRGDMKHLLEVVHVVSCPMNFKKLSNDNYTKWNKVMPNATELSEAGVSFAKVNHTTSLFDIKWQDGLMRIPSLDVVDSMETLLRNLIAYEQQSSDVHPTYFSDYATFMNHLITSEKDVKLLRRNGIIENWIGDDKEVVNIFNKMRNGGRSYSNFYYNNIYIKVFIHCEKTWNKIRANVMHNYFSKSWARASVAAGIMLFILTTIQTILAIISAFKSNK
ncbi:hypothetical protein MTR67_016554 [Solanum verrucosum]|uniref:Uncharacterized protein n=1 Tax=Solanum verrucosum TaxID=315347 RepID=A0AAF0TL27_SOLVR|nr:hypothetical protein MTR67_016554 [Solanum verrucosum]